MVTHLTTNPPVRCLNRAERTGSLVFNVLWSYVTWLPEVAYCIPIYIEVESVDLIAHSYGMTRSNIVPECGHNSEGGRFRNSLHNIW